MKEILKKALKYIVETNDNPYEVLHDILGITGSDLKAAGINDFDYIFDCKLLPKNGSAYLNFAEIAAINKLFMLVSDGTMWIGTNSECNYIAYGEDETYFDGDGVERYAEEEAYSLDTGAQYVIAAYKIISNPEEAFTPEERTTLFTYFRKYGYTEADWRNSYGK